MKSKKIKYVTTAVVSIFALIGLIAFVTARSGDMAAVDGVLYVLSGGREDIKY